MWGTTSPYDKLTGDFGDGFEVALIGDCRLFRPLAENWSQSAFLDFCNTIGTFRTLSFRRVSASRQKRSLAIHPVRRNRSCQAHEVRTDGASLISLSSSAHQSGRARAVSSISPNGVFDERYASNPLFSIASISAEVRILIDSLTFGPPSIGTLYPSISPKPSETSPQVVLEVPPRRPPEVLRQRQGRCTDR